MTTVGVGNTVGNNHFFVIVGADDRQTPPGFLCVRCMHFWPGDFDSLGERAGNECPSTTDPLMLPEVRAMFQPE